MWRKRWQQCPHASGGKTVQWKIGRERVGGGGDRGRRDKAVAIFTRCGQAADDMTRGGGVEGVGQGKREADDTTSGRRGWTARGKRAADDTTRGLSLRRQKMADTRMHGGQAEDNMTRGGGAEGAGRGEREAEDTTRGGRGWTTRGKRTADDTTRGLSPRRQKMVEPTHAGVRQCQSGNGGGDSSGGSWLQFVVGRGVPEDERHGGRSQQLDSEAGACWTSRGVGMESSLLLELLDYEGRP